MALVAGPSRIGLPISAALLLVLLAVVGLTLLRRAMTVRRRRGKKLLSEHGVALEDFGEKHDEQAGRTASLLGSSVWELGVLSELVSSAVDVADEQRNGAADEADATSRFVVRSLIFGRMADAAKGVIHFMNVVRAHCEAARRTRERERESDAPPGPHIST